MNELKTIAETNNYIVLNEYASAWQQAESYQSEDQLERELIADLVAQGYEYLGNIKSSEDLLGNVRSQLQHLNKVQFSEGEWARFVEEWLDNPGDNLIDKTRRVHDDYVKDFKFEDGSIKNITLFDKRNVARNKCQVIRQFEQCGTHANRYDVTILVNGLPLVQIELKKRGVAIREAFNQVHRYSKESFNSQHSLFKYLQLFVISNGTDTRYFANTTKRDKNSFDFTMNWAKADNSLLKDLKDFTATFLQKNTLLSVLLKYAVFDTSNTLLIMRPYQIAASERILWRIQASNAQNNWSRVESGGYIWHTTGSGKTLTSFKAARMATELEFIDKVFFVVDRKDLDYQTMKEYQRFSPDSVNGSESTAGLKANLDKKDNKIVVTTIQKLNNLMRGEEQLEIYSKKVVFIFDECHRSQFGEAQKNLKRKFKRFCQFGFTGTPIFPENALGAETTASVFGEQLHSYVITDAIRDEKVLKFKVDYNDVRPSFKEVECLQDEEQIGSISATQALMHPQRIKEIAQYILDNFRLKTHRITTDAPGFNAMLAVSSVDAAKLYYETFKNLQLESLHKLKVATIFSFAANEEQNAIGEIQDEGFNVEAMNSSAKEFLSAAIADYNVAFKSNYGVDSNGFQNYYRDLAKRVKNREIDLLIVVGMFLTGFDAPTLNTLFVDKNLRYHGLMQAYSRTNRIYDSTKTFGNIVTFRDLEKATIDAITLFGDKNTRNVLLEKSYSEYMEGFSDSLSGEAKRGYKQVVQELKEKFPQPAQIEKEADKKEFVKLFGEYLRLENILRNFDEFNSLQALQNIDRQDPQALEAFKKANHLSDADFEKLQNTEVLSEREIQDHRSTYNDIRDWQRNQTEADAKQKLQLDWDDVVFEVDLLKSQEINLDYIFALIFENNKNSVTKAVMVEDVRRVIRASIGSRAKESLLVDFITNTDLDQLGDNIGVMEAFYQFAQQRQQQEAEKLIKEQNLIEEPARRYISTSLKRERASDNGTELNSILPRMGRAHSFL